MRRQTEKQETETIGSGQHALPHPGCLPVQFQQRLESRPGTTSLPAEITLDHEKAVIKHRVGGVPVKVVVPASGFDGVMVRIVPGEAPGEIMAALILKHPDSGLSITLAETENSDSLAVLWSRWAQTLNLPMLVCDLGGKVKPIEAYSATPVSSPAPRRKLRHLTGRRPRFLNKRRPGHSVDAQPKFGHEREIIARS
ncbi:MAG: hypothetical protein JJ866_01625 [Roseibium sp.]|uniref:DUF6101 family protein n=1 Tax=Roseibium sp. TaxID=1936156 RepID=UPI001B0D62A9|nr:DUF6101 family protein [Roseibium sp.]MBO6890614.1 hypothetical protein [Roseibium sp.]MBO6930123.1 hypothetical protein [Roseibium sp.]